MFLDILLRQHAHREQNSVFSCVSVGEIPQKFGRLVVNILLLSELARFSAKSVRPVFLQR